MADFYKGYFDDRYSFAHSDKKWYNKNKDRVKAYNHEYYERHKKRQEKASDDIMLKNPSDKAIEQMEDGTIFKADFGGSSHYGVKYYNPDSKRAEVYYTDSLQEAMKASDKAFKYEDKRQYHRSRAAEKMEETFNSKGRKPGTIRLRNGRKVSSFENAHKAMEMNYR